MKILAIAVFVIAATIFSALMYGWALALLWSWFVAAQFGLPLLSLAQAIGLSLTVHLFTFKHEDDEKKKEFMEVIASSVAKAVLVPLFFAGYGWVVHQFI